MKHLLARHCATLLFAIAIFITSQAAFSADEPAPAGPGRHGWGHAGPGGGPGGGMGRGRGRGAGGPMRDDPEFEKDHELFFSLLDSRKSIKRKVENTDANAKAISMKVENTKKGVRVTETSKDPFVARLIQAHAQVVSLFLKNGQIEVSRNHAVPDEDAKEAANEQPSTPAKTGQKP